MVPTQYLQNHNATINPTRPIAPAAAPERAVGIAAAAAAALELVALALPLGAKRLDAPLIITTPMLLAPLTATLATLRAPLMPTLPTLLAPPTTPVTTDVTAEPALLV